MNCTKCGKAFTTGQRHCPSCGTARPPLDPRFQQVEDEYGRLLADLNAGRLTGDAFKTAIDKHIVDDGTRFWMMGVENGRWYTHDGSAWYEADPPLATAPAPSAAPSVSAPPPAAAAVSTPSSSSAMQRCPNPHCGRALPATKNFCTACGTRLA